MNFSDFLKCQSIIITQVFKKKIKCFWIFLCLYHQVLCRVCFFKNTFLHFFIYTKSSLYIINLWLFHSDSQLNNRLVNCLKHTIAFWIFYHLALMNSFLINIYTFCNESVGQLYQFLWKIKHYCDDLSPVYNSILSLALNLRLP